MSSSLLFSQTCLNPIQGLIDFTLDVKPFHTKILDAGIRINFKDDINVTIEEDFFTRVDQSFNVHTDNCKPLVECCELQGLETQVVEDPLGLEYVKYYSIVSDPRGLDINPATGYPYRPTAWFIGYNSHGIPTFYDFPLCEFDPPEPMLGDSCYTGLEVFKWDTDKLEYVDPGCETLCVSTPPCDAGLEEDILETNLLESSTQECEDVCGYQPDTRLGLEVMDLEISAIEWMPPLPEELWAANYYGPCSVPADPCPDVSHTTLSAQIQETLTIREDGLLLLEIA